MRLELLQAVLAPMPMGFMPMMAFNRSFPEVPCLADEHMPTDSGPHSLDLYGDRKWVGMRSKSWVLVAHPIVWAANGARNLADAYRPGERVELVCLWTRGRQ
jgi:hypothetical protein